MVQVIVTKDYRVEGDLGYANNAFPLIHIHSVRRHIHGNEVSITIKGDLRIAAKEVVYARDLKLNTIQTLQLTTETGEHTLYHPQKYIHAKGEYDNYASVDIFGHDDTEITAGSGPDEGSVWLDFEALGE